MEILWTSEEAEKATGGKATAKWQATGVSIDSRTVGKGDLFIAIKGENFDGHDFVADALQKGAAAAVVSKIPTGVTEKSPLLIVKDTFEGLKSLGSFSRARTKAKIIGVTGSVGKTSTKEMIQKALATQGKTYATVGNLNNHFGAPLSLARMHKDCDFGVFELGMNHAGEISVLTKIIKPHVAIITTVEAVHLEFFKSVAEIADAKSEIFEGMAGGVAVLNIDNPYYERMRKSAEKSGIKRIISFGQNDKADFCLSTVTNTNSGMQIKSECLGKSYEYSMQVRGSHQAKNSLGVLAVVDGLGADIQKAIKGISEFQVTKGRGQIHEIPVGTGKATLIDDAYNASPASMRAALEVLAGRRIMGGRAVAVLGDMRELGPTGGELHANLAQDVVANNIDIVFTAGSLMQNLHDALPKEKRGAHTKDYAEMIPVIIKAIKPNDVILVKSSNGSKMSKVVEAILEERKKHAV